MLHYIPRIHARSPMLPAPPYALDTPRFRFPALAALAGRSPLGGEREVVLAALLGARLVLAALPPRPLPHAARAARASGARSWLASLALPVAVRTPIARLIDATVDAEPASLAEAMGGAIEVIAPHLDAHALTELRGVANALALEGR